MKNKRGDIPVTILLIGVIAICGLAIFSFVASSFTKSQSFIGVSKMEELSAKIDSYYFYNAMGLSEEKLNEIVEIENNEIYLEQTKPHLIKEDEFLFSVKYVFP